LSVFYEGINSLSVMIDAGKDIDNIIPAGGLHVTRIQSVSLLGRHWVTPTFAVNLEFNFHQQGEFYTRRGIRAGVRLRL